MSGISLTLCAAGALGLVVLGGVQVCESLRALVGGLWGEIVVRAWREPRRALRSGLLTAMLQPASTTAARAAIAIGAARASSVGGALLFGVGLSHGSLFIALLAGLCVAGVPIREGACVMLMAGVLARSLSTDSRSIARAEFLSGHGLLWLGISGIAQCLERWDGAARFDAWNVSPFVRLSLVCVLGCGLTAFLRSTSFGVASAVAAAAANALELSSAAIFAMGSALGFAAPAVLSLRSSNADARRVALGLLAFHALWLLVGLTLLPWLSALASAMEIDHWSRILALCAWFSCSALVSTLVFVSLVRPLASLLDHSFVEIEEAVGRPRALSAELLHFPALALEAAYASLQQLKLLMRRFARSVLGEGEYSEKARGAERAAIGELSQNLSSTAEKLRSALTGPELGPRFVGFTQAMLGAQALASGLGDLLDRGRLVGAELDQALASRLRQLELLCLHLIEGVEGAAGATELAGELATLQQHATDLRGRALDRFAGRGMAQAELQLVLERLDCLQTVGEAGLCMHPEYVSADQRVAAASARRGQA